MTVPGKNQANVSRRAPGGAALTETVGTKGGDPK